MEVDTEQSNIRSTKVEKPLELEFDIGNLLVTDPNEIQVKALRCGKYLLHL